MKISIQTNPVFEEIEISLPHYVKDGICHFYKVVSETDYLQVYATEYGIGSISGGNSPFRFNSKTLPSSAEEFNAAFERVINELSSL